MKKYCIDLDARRIDVFDERWYPITLEGGQTVDLRNVTSILGIISKGYNFDEWLKNVGHNAEIIFDRAGTLGTNVHNLIERTLKGNKVSYDDSITVTEWERFLIWCELWKEYTSKYKVEIDPALVETIVYDLDLKYAGTLDLLNKENNEWVMWDWKTGNNIQKTPLQMIAYMRAAEKVHNIKIKKGYIGWMPSRRPNKKGYRIIEVENSDVLFDLFVSTKKMFDHEHGKEKPKYKIYPMDITLDYIKNNEIMKEA